jgi:hypothetical protein
VTADPLAADRGTHFQDREAAQPPGTATMQDGSFQCET